MTTQQPPRTSPAAPNEQVTQFLNVFADWLVGDARPRVVDQVVRLRELARVVDDTAAVDRLVAHLEDVVLRLDHLAATIAHGPSATHDDDVEALASDAADRCGVLREVIDHARLALAGPAGGGQRERAGAA
jgi:hypothetical protein